MAKKKITVGGPAIPDRFPETSIIDVMFLAAHNQIPPLCLPEIRFTRIYVNNGSMASYLVVEFYVIERQNLTPVYGRSAKAHDGRAGFQLAFTCKMPHKWPGMSPEARTGWIKGILVGICEHEIDEAMYRAGLRDDPHNPDSSLKKMIPGVER